MQNNDGFTLVETVVSLLLLSIIVMGFYNVYLSVNKMNHFSDKKQLAYQLCEEVLIQIKKGNIETKSNKYIGSFNELDIINIEGKAQYDFIENIKIIFEKLKINGEIVDNIYITDIRVSWLNNNSNLITIVEGGT